METGGYLNIYTNLFGWHLYGMFASVILNFGLWILPILVILWRNTVTFARENGGSDPHTTLVRCEFDIYSLIFIISIAFTPFISVNKTLFTHNNVSAGNTGTTYDAWNSQMPSQVKIPVLWYTLWQINGAITQVIKVALPTGNDIRSVMTQFQYMMVDDPNLANRLRGFNGSCMASARKLYAALSQSSDYQDSLLLQTMKERVSLHPSNALDDINYPGNNAFMVLYDPDLTICQSGQDPASTLCIPPVGVYMLHRTAGGCKSEWEDLRGKLYLDMENYHGTLDDMIGLATNLGVKDSYKDNAIRKGLSTGKLDGSYSRMYRSEQDSGLYDFFQEKIGTLSLNFSNLMSGISNEIVVNYIPVTYAIVVFLFVLFLPLMILLGGYRWDSLVRIVTLFFAIGMWLPVWLVINWLDNVLIAFLFRGQLFDKVFSAGYATLSFIMLLAYTFVPFLTSYIIYTATNNRIADKAGSIGGGGATTLEGRASPTSLGGLFRR